MKTDSLKQLIDEHYQKIEAHEGLNDSILAMIDADQKTSVDKRKKVIFTPVIRWAAAASVILAIGLYFALSDHVKDTCQTPEQAYQEIENALAIISTSCTKAYDIYAVQTNKPIQIIEKTLK